MRKKNGRRNTAGPKSSSISTALRPRPEIPALWSRPHESVKLSPGMELPILRGGDSDDPRRHLRAVLPGFPLVRDGPRAHGERPEPADRRSTLRRRRREAVYEQAPLLHDRRPDERGRL